MTQQSGPSVDGEAAAHEALSGMLGDAMDRLFRLRGVLDPAQAAEGLDMSMSEAMALRRLRRGSCTQNELRLHLHLERSTVSRLVDALVDRGWAHRQTDPANLRQRLLTLTPAGDAAAEGLARAMRARHDAMLATLTGEEREALAVALPALVRMAEVHER